MVRKAEDQKALGYRCFYVFFIYTYGMLTASRMCMIIRKHNYLTSFR